MVVKKETKAIIKRYKDGQYIGWNGVDPQFTDIEVEKLHSLGFTTEVELIEMEIEELEEV